MGARGDAILRFDTWNFVNRSLCVCSWSVLRRGCRRSCFLPFQVKLISSRVPAEKQGAEVLDLCRFSHLATKFLVPEIYTQSIHRMKDRLDTARKSHARTGRISLAYKSPETENAQRNANEWRYLIIRALSNQMLFLCRHRTNARSAIVYALFDSSSSSSSFAELSLFLLWEGQSLRRLGQAPTA